MMSLHKCPSVVCYRSFTMKPIQAKFFKLIKKRRIIAENILDMLRLLYSGRRSEEHTALVAALRKRKSIKIHGETTEADKSRIKKKLKSHRRRVKRLNKNFFYNACYNFLHHKFFMNVDCIFATRHCHIDFEAVAVLAFFCFFTVLIF